MFERWSRTAVSFVSLACVWLLAWPASAADEPAPRPNVVFVLMDDLRWDDLAFAGHPFAKTEHIDRIAREGATFTQAFATTPLCSPSRASFLTGLYAHRHGIVDNVDRSEASHRLNTFPKQLQAAGYETAFVGKWHMGVDDSPRAGFDRWVSVKGQGVYFDPTLNIDGREVAASGYVTDIFNDHALEFARRERAKPFLLYLAHKAVHPDLTQLADGSIADPYDMRFEPAPRHARLYQDAVVPHRPNHLAPPLDKPALMRKIDGLPPLGPETGTDDETVRDRLRMLAAADEGVGRLYDALAANGQLDQTVFIFTSDHGYFYGEHGLSLERRLAYEEAARIPLLIRYPKLIAAGLRIEPFAQSIDLAPTVLDLCGVDPDEPMHGRSLVPLLRGEERDWRTSILIEHASDKTFVRVAGMGYHAVRTPRHKYIHYRDLKGMDELYDLELDPYELNNRFADPAYAGVLGDLRDELDRLLAESQ